MPLEVKDVEWNETEDSVTLKVPLQGANAKNVDIFSSNKYIKVSFPPYLYEVGLFEEIDDNASKATISNGKIIFHLKKLLTKVWGQLHVSEHKDKAFMRELREAAIKDKQAKECERDKKKAQMKDEQKKFAVREQMRVDGEERKIREERKQLEMKEISQDMEQWKVTNKNNDMIPRDGDDDDGYVGDGSTHCDPNDTLPSVKVGSGHLDTSKNNETRQTIQLHQSPSNTKKQQQQEKNPKPLPEPRATGNIQINFTPRKLATPARESKLPEEEMWLKKVAEMNKMKSVENKDDVTDIEEMNPVWLKDKGNEFFKKGNYVGAINAYTSALVLDSSIPMVYSNRAACHLSLKQYRECIQDSSNALELYDPPVPANAMSRCRAFTRRGTAYYHLEQYVNALRDYEAAIKLDPQNDALRTDAFKIRRTLQGGDSSD